MSSPTEQSRSIVSAEKLRRSAWLIGLLAFGIYLGFIAWNLLR